MMQSNIDMIMYFIMFQWKVVTTSLMNMSEILDNIFDDNTVI